MASPFGVGDVIAVTTMLYNLYTAVQDTRRVPSEFQDTVRTLQELHRTFEHLSEDVQPVFSTNVPWLPDDAWTKSMRDRLEFEIKRIKLLVEEGREILTEGYVISSSDRSVIGGRRFRKKLKWPRTRADFEACLVKIDKSLMCVHHLMVCAQRYVCNICCCMSLCAPLTAH